MNTDPRFPKEAGFDKRYTDHERIIASKLYTDRMIRMIANAIDIGDTVTLEIH